MSTSLHRAYCGGDLEALEASCAAAEGALEASPRSKSIRAPLREKMEQLIDERDAKRDELKQLAALQLQE